MIRLFAKWFGLALPVLFFTFGGCGGAGQIQTYELSIAQGAGSGSYSPGDRVPIVADPAPEGQVFDRWTGDAEHLDSELERSTMLTMPARKIEIAATFRDESALTFQLAVVGGTGSGSFAEGSEVTIEAGSPPMGKVFDRWTGDTEYLDSATSSRAVVTMPAVDVRLTATYRGTPAFSGSWTREILEFKNSSYSGNPFELEIDATFTHASSGAVIKLPGYYAGNDTWKVAFMPTQEGVWNWETTSSDSDLHGKTGQYEHTKSGELGFLAADVNHPKKWRLSGGPYVVPIALRCEFFTEPGSASVFESVANFMKDHNILMLETRLTEQKGQFENGRRDFIFEGDWGDHKFDLRIWDRMDERMSMLAERGLGAHIMFYSDDGGKPGWGGQTETEALVIRYTIARLASYPIVMFNTGIDIAEYRNQSDIDWMGQKIRLIDPYGHPVSSRRGGGSGSMAMVGRTFDSIGQRTAVMSDLLDLYEAADAIPVSTDDAWGENRGSHSTKDHAPEDIRRGFWKCIAAGGVGGLVRGGGDGGDYTGYFHFEELASDLESEQWLQFVNPFVRDELGETFGEMEPDAGLVQGGYAIADDDRDLIFIFLIGKNDRYDNNETGGAVTLKLADLSGSYTASWFDTRTGKNSSAGSFDGGKDHTVDPPSTDDWVLLLRKS